MAKERISQVIAVHKSTKARTTAAITALHRTSSKPDLFNGQTRDYSPVRDDGTKLPNETVPVQQRVDTLLNEVRALYVERHDKTATLEFSNQTASADVVVDGTILIEKAPVSLLLYLEKELEDWRTFVEALPVLNPAVVWRKDEGRGLYVSETKRTARTEKVQEPLVLYPATPEHPAQTQMITKDVIAGWWDTTQVSGAISETRKRELLNRVNRLRDAVKSAREAANSSEATRKDVGEKIFAFLIP